MIFLDQDRVEKADPVIAAAATADSVLSVRAANRGSFFAYRESSLSSL